MVLLRGKTARKPSEVWTGSTNLTDGGIYGQANVGHRVRDERDRRAVPRLLEAPRQRPRRAAPTPTKDPLNIAFLAGGRQRSRPRPPSSAKIPAGITPLFSPRSNIDADRPLRRSCSPRRSRCRAARSPSASPCRSAPRSSANTRTGRSASSCSRRRTSPKPTKAHPGRSSCSTRRTTPTRLRAQSCTPPLGRWVAETNNKKIGLNQHVTYIHLKFILHDPLGPDPIVVTGSANFSEASTIENDENMILIRGDRRVADIYFTEFNRLWGHYYYRSVVEATTAHPAKPGTPRTAQLPGPLRNHRMAEGLRARRPPIEARRPVRANDDLDRQRGDGARRARTADLLGAIQDPRFSERPVISIDWPDVQGFC